jgi:hypothetical protein
VTEAAETLLNADVHARSAAWRTAFATAQPFRHVVIDDFLDGAFAQRLLAQFPPFDRGNAIGDDGQPGNKSTLARIRALGETYVALDAAIQSPAFLAWLGDVTGIDDLLYDPYYLGGGTHENRDGQNLQTHIDFNYHPSERWHRRLNLIVYLNPAWEEAWGGNLDLYRDPYSDVAPAVRVVPRFNRCVIFETTETSWHGFERITLPDDRRDLSRRSIALYFYTRQRPADETAGKHSTHYVDAQLPPRYAPGYTLTETDVAQLRLLIAQRDGQLRRLYAENASLLQAQERGFIGKILYLLKRVYVRYRR